MGGGHKRSFPPSTGRQPGLAYTIAVTWHKAESGGEQPFDSLLKFCMCACTPPWGLSRRPTCFWESKAVGLQQEELLHTVVLACAVAGLA